MDTLQYLSESDDTLAVIIQKIGPLEPLKTNGVFHDLLACIIEQQIPYRSTKNTFLKLLSNADLIELTTENFEEFEEKALPLIKLSERKYEAINSALEFFTTHQINWLELSSLEVERNLKLIAGVGNWTIQMIQLYTLNRPNVFPVDDYHLKIIMTELYGLEQKGFRKNAKQIASKWAPHSSLAVRYLLEWKRIKNQFKE